MYRDQNDVVVAFQDAVGILFANSFEKMTLWKEYSPQWNKESKHTWNDFNWGQLRTVGYISNNKNRPVCISVGAFKLNGRVILTVEDTSRWVDHTMIKDWLVKNWPHLNVPRDHHIDPMNFHILVHHIADLNKEAA